jgi:hypothetical protein
LIPLRSLSTANMMPLSLLSKDDSGLDTTTKNLVKSYHDEYKDATNCVTSWLMTNSNNKRYTANNLVPMAKHIRTPQHILTALATAIRLREKTTKEFQTSAATWDLTNDERIALQADNRRHIHFWEQLKAALVILTPAVRPAGVSPGATEHDLMPWLSCTPTTPSRDAWVHPFLPSEGAVSKVNSNRRTPIS